ncbi:MAG: hypothetical protein U9N62_09530, partial [Thermotogota bacterium]|nr:hypothetical protein [Thermotogota bacterium]
FSPDYNQLSQTKIKRNKITKIPFSIQQPPIEIETEFFSNNDWQEENGNACLPSEKTSKKTNQKQKKKLVPYGCTDLRITCFP